MDNERIIEEAKAMVSEFHGDDATGHDYWHVMRVYNNAYMLQSTEGGDLFTIKIATLFHDMIDYKMTDDEGRELNRIVTFLEDNGVARDTIDKIIHAMQAVSFKGGTNPVGIESIEDAVVQDADRLDALGAIGIARTMVFGGSKNHKLHDPKMHARENLTFEQYSKEDNTIINHFYEKLLKLKNLMHTKSARLQAEKRHEFMERYLEQFYNEWDGKL